MGKTQSFKHEFSIDQRLKESTDMLAKYPDRIPVVAEKYSRTDLPELDNKKDKAAAADETFFTVRDRKVRISDRGSIYALCRSWLRNGYPEESQPQPSDVLKSLPKPLPMPDSSLRKRKERDDETKPDEDVKVAETSYTNELLQRHIKQAKRVRERLREERLQRIERYEKRLALLLPPVVECRNEDSCTGI